MSTFYAPTPENPGRILVVDDLPGNLKVLGMELRNHPFALTLARNAEEALELCRRLPFGAGITTVCPTLPCANYGGTHGRPKSPAEYHPSLI